GLEPESRPRTGADNLHQLWRGCQPPTGRNIRRASQGWRRVSRWCTGLRDDTACAGSSARKGGLVKLTSPSCVTACFRFYKRKSRAIAVASQPGLNVRKPFNQGLCCNVLNTVFVARRASDLSED